MSQSEIFRTLLDTLSEHAALLTKATATGFALQFLAGQTIAGYYDRLVARAERWQKGGAPTPGFGTFRGRVLSTRERDLAGATEEARRIARIENPVVLHVRTQRNVGSGLWMDVSEKWKCEPFHLTLADESEIMVHPGEPHLGGYEESDERPGRVMRQVKEQVYSGEWAWVTGYLEPAPKGMGAYRGGGAPRSLRAPKGGKVWITRMAPADEWRKMAGAHRWSGYTALACMGLGALIAYKAVIAPLAITGEEAKVVVPTAVLFGWAALVGVSLYMWVRSVRRARRAWARRFWWM